MPRDDSIYKRGAFIEGAPMPAVLKAGGQFLVSEGVRARQPCPTLAEISQRLAAAAKRLEEIRQAIRTGRAQGK